MEILQNIGESITEAFSKAVEASIAVPVYVFIIFTILWIGFCVYKAANADGLFSMAWIEFGAFFGGGACILLTISFINSVCLKKK